MDSQRRIQLQFDQIRSRSKFSIIKIYSKKRKNFVFSEKVTTIT